MDIKTSTDFRLHNLEYSVNNNKYDYVKYGILRLCLPKILFAGNSILVSFIQLIDMRLIMMFKYIDKIKNFKNIAQY
jgi:hypothetical protein